MIYKNLWKIFSDQWDLGVVTHARRNYIGYINVTYEVDILNNLVDRKQKRLILRIYRKGTSEEKIRFEHALLDELHARKFDLSPCLIETKNGKTFVKVNEQLDHGPVEYYLAAFSYLQGKDKYAWNSPLCTENELKNAAGVLAAYHHTIYGWEGIPEWRGQRSIETFPEMIRQWNTHARNSSASFFDLYFKEELDYLLRQLQKVPDQTVYDAMPHLAVHGDYHPGNIKFLNGKVVGVFDFDWSAMDARCYDVGNAILFFCADWNAATGGKLIRNRVDRFLEAYQKKAANLNGIGPLNTLELEYLPEMIRVANLHSVLDWTLDHFYNVGADPQECTDFLKQSIRVSRWLEGHRERLAARIMKHRF
ncbi:MAG: phosphotransferase [Deltaproteobacteria bacterium]|nr:phosphotransferase [Deltaproteobacteria bacterium]